MGKVKPVNMVHPGWQSEGLSHCMQGMVFGKIDVECAKFDIVSEGKDFQVRRYHPAVAAQVKTTDDNGGFRQLARYIGVFGTPENGSNQAVSMTAPVVSTPQSISMTAPVTSTTDTMQFILPSVLSMENAPKPSSPDVELVRLPSRTYAVRQYSGSTTIEDATGRVQEFVTDLEANTDLTIDSQDWELYRYNPPMTLPFLRTNEIAVRVIESTDAQ